MHRVLKILLLLAILTTLSASVLAASRGRALGGGPSTGPSGGVGAPALRMQP